MQIKINLEKKEIKELIKSKEYLQLSTNTKTVRTCVHFFYTLSRKYDIILKEKKKLLQKISQLERQIAEKEKL
jgi:glycyl-tRNA synthetase alpha subunit